MGFSNDLQKKDTKPFLNFLVFLCYLCRQNVKCRGRKGQSRLKKCFVGQEIIICCREAGKIDHCTRVQRFPSKSSIDMAFDKKQS